MCFLLHKSINRCGDGGSIAWVFDPKPISKLVCKISRGWALALFLTSVATSLCAAVIVITCAAYFADWCSASCCYTSTTTTGVPSTRTNWVSILIPLVTFRSSPVHEFAIAWSVTLGRLTVDRTWASWGTT